MTASAVGVIGGGPPALVDEVGTLYPSGASWTCEWWIGGDDRWHLPVNEVAVRQQRLHNVPVLETAMRVPGGDAVQRVYGAAAPGNPIVMEIDNQSPAPFVVAFVLRGVVRAAAEGPHAAIDNAFVLSWQRAPSRWARAVTGGVQMPVVTGHAQTGPFPRSKDRAGRMEVAFLHPVAHRTTLRMAVTRSKTAPDFDVRALPDAESAATGWRRVLDRGMQIVLPDRPLEARLRAARAEVLLRGQAIRPGAAVVAALEDWGLDDEAAEAWRRLGGRERKEAAVRAAPGSWAALDRIGDEADLLLAARRILVVDARDGSRPVGLCVDHPESWRGQALEVREAPVSGGVLSYAVRWHGERPALLWDGPPGTTVRVPGLDPGWRSDDAAGEALLGPVPGAA